MNDELFNELLESVREGGLILRGEKLPSRSFNVGKPDFVRDIVNAQNPNLKDNKKRKTKIA